MIYQLILTFLLCAACLGQPNEFGCDKTYQDGADKIYDKHCPEFPKMLKYSTSAYGDCLEDQGIDFFGAVEACLPKFGFKASRDPVTAVNVSCDPNNAEQSHRMICCLITQELSGTTKTGEYKFEASQKCVDGIKSKYGIK